MDTLAPEPVYRIWSGGPEMNPAGTDNVRRFYIEQIFGKGRHCLEFNQDRITVADDAIVNEGVLRTVMWGRDLIDTGKPVDDPDGAYLVHYRMLIVWPYDAEGRIIGEESWSSIPKDNARKIDEADAPDNFRRYVARRRAELATAA
jgi:hypothetical protein